MEYVLTKADIERLVFINEHCKEIEQIMQGNKSDAERGIPTNENLKYFRDTAIGTIAFKMIGYCVGFDDEFRSKYDQVDWDYVEMKQTGVVRHWRDEIHDFVQDFVSNTMPPWKALSEKIVAENPKIVRQVKSEIVKRFGNWAYGRESLRGALIEVYGTANIFGNAYRLTRQPTVDFQFKKKDIEKLFQIKEYCREIDECMERFKNKPETKGIKTDSVGFSVLQISVLCSRFGERFKHYNSQFDWNGIADIENSIANLWSTEKRDFIWNFVHDVKPNLQDFCDKVIIENPEITKEIKIKLAAKYPNWSHGRAVMRDALIVVYGTDDISVIKKQTVETEQNEELSEEIGMEMS